MRWGSKPLAKELYETLGKMPQPSENRLKFISDIGEKYATFLRKALSILIVFVE